MFVVLMSRYAAAIGADSFNVWGKDSPSAIAKQLVSDGKTGEIRWLDKDGFEGYVEHKILPLLYFLMFESSFDINMIKFKCYYKMLQGNARFDGCRYFPSISSCIASSTSRT